MGEVASPSVVRWHRCSVSTQFTPGCAWGSPSHIKYISVSISHSDQLWEKRLVQVTGCRRVSKLAACNAQSRQTASHICYFYFGYCWLIRNLQCCKTKKKKETLSVNEKTLKPHSGNCYSSFWFLKMNLFRASNSHYFHKRI